MKFNFYENPLKLTYFANLYAMIGLFNLFWYLHLCLKIYMMIQSHLTGSEGVIFDTFLKLHSQTIVSAICFLLFIVEILFKHQMKNRFVKENKIYNLLFYIGFVFNTLVLFLAANFYFRV